MSLPLSTPNQAISWGGNQGTLHVIYSKGGGTTSVHKRLYPLQVFTNTILNLLKAKAYLAYPC